MIWLLMSTSTSTFIAVMPEGSYDALLLMQWPVLLAARVSSRKCIFTYLSRISHIKLDFTGFCENQRKQLILFTVHCRYAAVARATLQSITYPFNQILVKLNIDVSLN